MYLYHTLKKSTSLATGCRRYGAKNEFNFLDTVVFFSFIVVCLQTSFQYSLQSYLGGKIVKFGVWRTESNTSLPNYYPIHVYKEKREEYDGSCEDIYAYLKCIRR